MLNRLKSYVETFKFFLCKKDCRVIYFRVPSSVLFSFLDYDIVKYVSDKINIAQQTDLTEIDRNVVSYTLETANADNSVDDTTYLKIKSLLKLAWLIRELNSNPMHNPVQLLQSGTRYFCHPGADRVVVSTYLQPVDTVCGFYLWYPELDANPFILDYDHYEIKCPFHFISKFKFSDTMKISYIHMTNELDTSDKVAPTNNNRNNKAQECFAKTVEKFDIPFLSFDDRVQWSNPLYFKESLKFINDTECYLADIKFTKINGTWIAND